MPSLPVVPAAVTDDRPRPLHTPPAWTVARGGTVAGTPAGRVENANAAARVEPRREGYYNAIQIFPWSEGALYQVYAAVGQITSIALEPGESLTGAGPIAAGDTARWIIGDTERQRNVAPRPYPRQTNPAGHLDQSRRDHRPAHLLDRTARPRSPLHAGGGLGLSRATSGPAPDRSGRSDHPAEAGRNYRYGLTGDNPP